MEPTPRFIQGVFPFEGRGLNEPVKLGPEGTYEVPSDKRAQLIYLRSGNSCDELISLTLTCNGKPLRLFPLGAKSSAHVPLAVVEDIHPDSMLEVLIAAPSGCKGLLVLDLGLLEAD